MCSADWPATSGRDGRSRSCLGKARTGTSGTPASRVSMLSGLRRTLSLGRCRQMRDTYTNVLTLSYSSAARWYTIGDLLGWGALFFILAGGSSEPTRILKSTPFFSPRCEGEHWRLPWWEDQAPLTGRSFNGTNVITRAISSNDGEDISDRFKSNGNQ